MLASVIAFWVFMTVRTNAWDLDIWFHLRNAEYLLTHGHTPQFDIFSYTAQGYPLLDHQWLAEIPYYLAWRLGGLSGLLAFTFGLLTLIHFAMYYRAWRESGNLKAAALVCCLSIFLTSVSFAPRTLLFSYVCLLILLLLLDRYRRAGKSPLWAVPLLFCLWINCHGSWPLGFIVLGIYIVSGLVEGAWGQIEFTRWTSRQIRQLLVTTAASVVALFVNPFGYKLVLYPYEMSVRQKLNVAFADEWASVDFHDPHGKVVLILLGVVFLGILLSGKKWKGEEVLLAGFALYSGLTHVRFLVLVAILLTPLLAKMFDFLPPYRSEIDKPWLNAAVIAVLLAILIPYVPSRDDLRRGVEARFPTQALDFARAQGLQGNFFNAYHWGGYMIYYAPEYKTFIDSRADLFEYTGVLRDYLNAEGFRDSLQVLDKYRVRYALLPVNDPLGYLLKNTDRWKPLYSDDVAVILERVSPLTSTAGGTLPGAATRVH